MSLFGKVVKLVVNVAALPVEVVKDVFTLGGVATENGQPYTVERVKKIVEDAD